MRPVLVSKHLDRARYLHGYVRVDGVDLAVRDRPGDDDSVEHLRCKELRCVLRRSRHLGRPVDTVHVCAD